MTYQSTLAQRLRDGVADVLASTPQPGDVKDVKDWLESTGVSSRGPSGTAPPVVIGWIAQTVLNESFDADNFKSGVLVTQGNAIISALSGTNVVTLISRGVGQTGADTLIGSAGTVDTFLSDDHEKVNPGTVGTLGMALQEPSPPAPPAFGAHNDLVVAWVFQSLVVENPMTVAVKTASEVKTLGQNLQGPLTHVGP